jgi:hypothetical protein
MFRLGVNVTQVAFEDFVGLEGIAFDAAAQVTRVIYERRSVESREAILRLVIGCAVFLQPINNL